MIKYKPIEKSNNKIDFVLTKEPKSFNSILLDDVAEISKIPYLCEPILIQSGLAGIVGTSDIGKSTLARQLMISVANGENTFLNHFRLSSIHQKVLYVSSEDEPETVKLLMQQQAENLGLSMDFLKNIRIMTDFIDLPNNIENDLCLQNFDLIVIDTFGDVFKGGDINKSTDVRTFLNLFQTLAIKYKCLIVFLHHTGKGKQNGEPSKDNILGSQGFESKMRLILELKEDFTNPDNRHLCITKGNYLSNELKRESFVLSFINKCFEFTGEKIKFDLIRKDTGAVNDNKNIKIKEMLLNNKSYTDIETELGVHPSRIAKVSKQLKGTTTTANI